VDVEYVGRYLALKLAPLLCGVKPGVLLRASDSLTLGGRGHCELLRRNREEATRLWGLGCETLEDKEGTALVLFYSEELLSEELRDEGRRAFLSAWGYPSEVRGVSGHLEQLRRRFAAGGFPHEVGAFLGYPLKDVRGFVEGRPAGRCWGVGWKVYDEPEESLALARRHRRATEMMSLALRLGVSPAPAFAEISKRDNRKET